jgi:hypothetical protein
MTIPCNRPNIKSGLLYRQKMKCTMESYPHLKDMLLEEVGQWWKRDSREVTLFYWTFEHDDRVKLMATLICLSASLSPSSKRYHERMFVVAMEDDIDAAIQWVKDNNPHLRFSDEQPVKGYNNEDFVHNRITAQLNFTSK